MPKDNQDIDGLTNEIINETIERINGVLAKEHAAVAAYCLMFVQGYMHGVLEAQGNTEALGAVILSARHGVNFGRERALRECAAVAQDTDVPAQNAPTSQARN